jgi:hypothetical protein
MRHYKKWARLETSASYRPGSTMLQHWDTKPHIIAASGDDGWFDWEAELPRQVPWRELLIAEDEGRPVGVLQVIDPAQEESHYWGDVAPNLRAIDIWIGDESDLGRGLGCILPSVAAFQIPGWWGIDRCTATRARNAFTSDSGSAGSSGEHSAWTNVSYIGSTAMPGSSVMRKHEILIRLSLAAFHITPLMHEPGGGPSSSF